MENQNQNNQEEAGKVAKNYKATMKKLVAVMGGEEKLFPEKKISGDVVSQVVTGLLKERKEKLEKEVTSELSNLLDKHVELKKQIAEKHREFIKLEETKQKEFNEAAARVFAKIDNINELEKSYYSTLNDLGSSESMSSKPEEPQQ